MHCIALDIVFCVICCVLVKRYDFVLSALVGIGVSMNWFYGVTGICELIKPVRCMLSSNQCQYCANVSEQSWVYHVTGLIGSVPIV